MNRPQMIPSSVDAVSSRIGFLTEIRGTEPQWTGACRATTAWLFPWFFASKRRGPDGHSTRDPRAEPPPRPPVHSPKHRAVGTARNVRLRFPAGLPGLLPPPAVRLAAPLTPRSAVGQDEILYMGFDGTKIGLPKDFVLTDYSKVRARSPELAPRESTCVSSRRADCRRACAQLKG